MNRREFVKTTAAIVGAAVLPAAHCASETLTACSYEFQVRVGPYSPEEQAMFEAAKKALQGQKNYQIFNPGWIAKYEAVS